MAASNVGRFFSKWQRPIFVAAVVAMALTISACSSSVALPFFDSDGSGAGEPTPTPAPTVTPTPTPLPPPPPPRHLVGIVMADSGPLAPIEQPVKATIEFAFELVNRRGGLNGKQIAVRFVDSGSTFSGSSDGAQQLLDAGAVALFVSCDESIASAAIEVANAAEVVTLSPCGSGQSWLSQSFGPLSFSFGHRWSAEGEVMAETAIANGWDTAYAVVENSSTESKQICDGFFARYQQLGGVLVSDPIRYSFENLRQVEDNLAVNDAARAAKTVVVCSYLPGGFIGGPELVEALRTAGVKAPLLSGSLLDGDEWVRVAEQVTDLGLLVIVSPASVHGDDPSPAVNEVFASIDDGTGTLNRGWAIEGADAAVAWALAAERAGVTTGPAVAGQLEAFRNQELVSRSVTFSATEHASPVTELRIIRYDGIGFQFVATYPVD